MKYIELLNFFKKTKIIKSEDIPFLGNPNTIRPQLSRWAKSGKLIELKKGYYLLPRNIITSPPLFYIANTIYFPSYISLQSALSLYGLIPESVYSITSVSTKKTSRIQNRVGNFIYRKIKKELFFGYIRYDLDNFPVLIAEPEKALLDTVYLTHMGIQSLRIQNYDSLNKNKIKKMLDKFPKSVKKIIGEIL